MKKGYSCEDGKYLNVFNKNIEGLCNESYISTVEFINILNVADEIIIDYSVFSSLKTLIISSSGKYTFPKEICYLPQLEKITCSGGCLIPQEIGEAKSLKSLSINGDCVMNMPISILEVDSLEVLSIDYYSLGSCKMPAWICKIKQLKQLYLWSCLFTELDSNICNLKELEVLKINGSLSVVKDFPLLTDMPKLIDLVIPSESQMYCPKPDYQLLSKILKGISMLSDLKYLDLSGWRSRKKSDYLVVTEQGKSIPDLFYNFLKLESLDISGMKLDFLPESIYHLPSLKFIDIKGNNLSEVCLQRFMNMGIRFNTD